MKNRVILAVGGDLRQTYTARDLSIDNTVYACGFDDIDLDDIGNVKLISSLKELDRKADIIILPLPASEDGTTVWTPFSKNEFSLESIIEYIDKNGIAFGGRLSDSVADIFAEKGIEAIDYYKREEMSVMNAVPTAEGAVQIAMEELPTTIFGTKVLILGNGRIARALIPVLHGLGADVTVAARKYEALAWAKISGCKAIHMSEIFQNIGDFDLIFNTVPAVVLGESELSEVKSSTLIIDLASKPGGVDFDAASLLGLKTIWALSLPGKSAPESSGKIIAKTIGNILTERGVT